MVSYKYKKKGDLVMKVYVNWETQEIVGPNQVEEIIDRKLSDYLANDDFLMYLEERNYTLVEVWYMDDKQKESIMEDFTTYQRELVGEWFDEEFCEYEVE